MPLCSNALKHVCNPSEGIPADVTSGDDVASSKYKSTCGGVSGSYCCSVSALWVLHLIYCCLSCLKFIMATGKHESDRQRFRILVPPCPCFITGGDTHSLCVACLGEEHPWGGTTHSILSLNRGFRDLPPVQSSLYEKIVCHCLPHRCFYTSWLLRHLQRWHQQGFPRMDYTCFRAW